MIDIKEVIIVEGKYDKMRVERVCSSPVFTTDGFRIFKNKQKRDFFRNLAKSRGIIVLTDSDRAGFMIRNYIKGFVPDGNIRQAYIPEVFGKERRKASFSKEGKLGVEGMEDEILIEVLKKYASPASKRDNITKLDLYAAGLYGAADSSKSREKLCSALMIPKNISVSSLVDALNALITKDEFYKYIQ